MSCRHRIPILMLPCTLAVWLHAAGAASFTLDSAVRTALARHPAIAAARAEVAAAEARLDQAGRFPNPLLETGYAPNVNGREWTLSGGVVQPVPVAARLSRARAVARAELEAARADARDAERRLAAEVRLLLVRLLGVHEQRRLGLRQVANSRELAEAMTRHAASGEISSLDAAQVALETRRLELALLELDSAEEELLSELRPMLGLDEAVPVILTDTLEAPAPPAPAKAMERPDRIAAAARATAARHAVDLARAHRWQDLEVGLFAEFERSEDEPRGLEEDRTIGLRLSFPLPLWERKRGGVAEAAAREERAARELDLTDLRIRSQQAAHRTRMQAAMRRETAIKEQLLPMALDLERRLEAAHRQGQAALVEVLRARERRLELEGMAVEARIQFHLARVRYEAAAPDHPHADTRAPE